MENIDTPADPITPKAPQPVSYIAYDADTGALLGGFLQVPPDDHACIIEVSGEVRLNWPAYQLNVARDGVELAPPAPPAPPVIPQQVAMWQARAVLIEDDLLDAVNGALAAIADDKARRLAQAKFEYSSTVRRDDPLVTETIPSLGKSEAQIDAMFVRAAGLQ